MARKSLSSCCWNWMNLIKKEGDRFCQYIAHWSKYLLHFSLYCCYPKLTLLQSDYSPKSLLTTSCRQHTKLQDCLAGKMESLFFSFYLFFTKATPALLVHEARATHSTTCDTLPLHCTDYGPDRQGEICGAPSCQADRPENSSPARYKRTPHAFGL